VGCLVHHGFNDKMSSVKISVCEGYDTPRPTPEPTPVPTPAPTEHPCDDGSHGCDKGAGGICVKEGNDYACKCAHAFKCTAGCGHSHQGHTCERTAKPTPAPTPSPTMACTCNVHTGDHEITIGTNQGVSHTEAWETRGRDFWKISCHHCHTVTLFDNDDHYIDNKELNCCGSSGCSFTTGWNHDLRNDVAKINMAGNCYPHAKSEPCKLTTPASTTWGGYYVQNGRHHAMDFSLTFHPGGSIDGSGRDGIGGFTWEGAYSGTHVHINKHYNNGNTVVYSGTLSSSGMSGTWSYGSSSDDFELTQTSTALKMDC